MVIGSLDWKVTLQKTKAAKRKLKQERYEERNKILTGVSSSSMDLSNECKLKERMCEHLDLSAPSAIIESGAQNTDDVTVKPVATKLSAVARTLDRFSISDRAGAAIVSAALQYVGIISESNVSNVVDRNKIRLERTKARTTLSSQSVIKDYDHEQFGLYFDRRKDGTLSMDDSRKKVIIEEHISLVKEPGSEYIGHLSINFGRQKIIGNNIYSFLSCVDNDIDVTKLVATEHLSTRVSKEGDLKDVIDPVIKRNEFFGPPENVLISMLADDRNRIREFALRRILKARKVKRSAATTTIGTNNIRIFNLPAFDLCAMDYVDLIKWENVSEPPLTERFSGDMIAETIVKPSNHSGGNTTNYQRASLSY
ncbi:hypothetical protein AVEN_255193-1 [Araneus ventricosus]|uniref:Uncharacterized protein n=1 Tax=Araneus ventricosus TaxID=182803 RepID=A0A4Y2B9M1_ARAVE|nr:hypothetical protein AVEN_255193-1 [Araneus ventricosus]